MSPILPIGATVIVAVVLIYSEIEKHRAASASASNAQAEADASVYAVEGQGQEITNIAPGGTLPANYVGEETTTEPVNTTMNNNALAEKQINNSALGLGAE